MMRLVQSPNSNLMDVKCPGVYSDHLLFVLISSVYANSLVCIPWSFLLQCFTVYISNIAWLMCVCAGALNSTVSFGSSLLCQPNSTTTRPSDSSAGSRVDSSDSLFFSGSTVSKQLNFYLVGSVIDKVVFILCSRMHSS